MKGAWSDSPRVMPHRLGVDAHTPHAAGSTQVVSSTNGEIDERVPGTNPTSGPTTRGVNDAPQPQPAIPQVAYKDEEVTCVGVDRKTGPGCLCALSPLFSRCCCCFKRKVRKKTASSSK